MPPVAVRILHPEPDAAAGPLTRWVADARADLAQRHRRGFLAVGAGEVETIAGPGDARSFGERLRGLVDPAARRGLVVLGSGAIPLATAADRRDFVMTAAREGKEALANNRYSADIVALSRADTLPEIPALPGDNALPRWLEEVAGYRVSDLRRRWRLGFDIDGPLDLVLLGLEATDPSIETATVAARLAAVREVAADRRSELLIAGRTSAATLGWLERHTAARTRAWIEERGLRAASRLAQAGGPPPGGPGGREAASARRPASILGAALERDGPGSLGRQLARFADAAILDTRVLLAHRLGPDEAAWPVAEDRFASDLLLADRIADPWLRELTAAAVAAPIPILLGGHTLVGPGVRLAIDGPPRSGSWR
ncbi:MAG: hypothetical protein QOC97_960 [Chloroflexota bacterium]|nr:hypothetical protein [Chloroflexota bacterium]